jgi:preprotein translocase subunit SecA
LEDDHRDEEGLLRWVNTTMPLGLRKEDIDWSKSPAEIAAEIQRRTKQAYELKIKFEVPEAVQAMERMILLSAIDRLWQEHLYAMDGLRTSIGLRAYAQKDPLIEYKQEAYQMFEELMDRIKRETVHNLFRSTTSLSAFDEFLRHLPQFLGRGPAVVLDAPAPQDRAARPPEAPAASPPDITLPIHRELPKIGRNEMVTIRRGGETKTLKFKKAEPMLKEGWSLVEPH